MIGSQAATLVELLRGRSEQEPDRWAYSFLEDGEEQESRLTYGELDVQARAVAAALHSRGACAGERALLLYEPGLPFIGGFFGCLYAGLIAVPVPAPDETRLRQTVARLCTIRQSSGARWLLCSHGVFTKRSRIEAHAPALAEVGWVDSQGLAGANAEAWAEPPGDPTSLALLQYTSGSTGAPRGVVLSHGNLLHNHRAQHSGLGQNSGSIGVSWVPVFHDLGLIGNVLSAMYLGHPTVLMSPAHFLAKPVRWLRAISRYRATFSGAPNFAYDLCARRIAPEHRAELDLRTWQVAFNAGEPIRASSLERFAKAFEPCGFRFEAFSSCYGLAEATLIAASTPAAERPVVRHFDAAELQRDRAAPDTTERGIALVGSGRPLHGQAIAVVDTERNTPCQAGQVGEIWIAGGSVAQGYWQEDEVSAQIFGARMEADARRYLRTGDLGFLLDGELFVTGRSKDLLILRGQNHYPQDVERTVEECHEAFRPGCVAAFACEEGGRERLVVVGEVNPSLAAAADQLERIAERAIADRHGLRLQRLVLIEPRTIPKTSSGKIQRRACRQALEAGELSLALAEETPAT